MTEDDLRKLEPIEVLKLLHDQVEMAIDMVEAGGLCFKATENLGNPVKPLFVIGDFEVRARFRNS